MHRIEKWIHRSFLLGLLLLLLVSLGRTVFLPKDINEYENRYASRVIAPSADNLLNGTFQSALENALNDQIPLAMDAKNRFNRLVNRVRFFLLDTRKEQLRGRYVTIKGIRYFNGDRLVAAPDTADTAARDVEPMIESLNAVIDAHPELRFYGFYVEGDRDNDFEQEIHLDLSGYLADALHLPEGSFGRFRVDNFQTFDRYFYRSDHHWNWKGSYLGYQNVLALLRPEEAPLEPLEEVLISSSFSGARAKAVGATGVITESFSAYRYPYPPMDVTLDRQAAPDYGAQDYWMSGGTGKLSYANFYGTDYGEVVLSAHQPGRGTVLILGDSFDNAILKLLASHFDTVYSVDLRFYEPLVGEPFRFTDYVNERGIDTVLFIGSASYFRSADFLVEG